MFKSICVVYTFIIINRSSRCQFLLLKSLQQTATSLPQRLRSITIKESVLYTNLRHMTSWQIRYTYLFTYRVRVSIKIIVFHYRPQTKFGGKLMFTDRIQSMVEGSVFTEVWGQTKFGGKLMFTDRIQSMVEGNVFTGVCLSIEERGAFWMPGCTPWIYIPWMHPLPGYTPNQGMHPWPYRGMHTLPPGDAPPC